MSHEIVTRAEAGVSTIAFNRLERKNSITGPMYAALAEALNAAATDPSMTSCLVTSSVLRLLMIELPRPG